jgi:ABC-type xylose transport system permease subunit
MNVSKPDGETVEEVDPIEAIKGDQDARMERIGQQVGLMMMVAILGMVILTILRVVDAPHRSPKNFVYDISFIQRVYFMGIASFFSCIAIVLLAAIRGIFAGFFSAKPRTPSVLIGLIGLCILIFVAAGFFSRPYTGAGLNPVVDGRYFMGGWFLLVWGIVFRK